MGIPSDVPIDDLLTAIESTGALVTIQDLPQDLAGACVVERGRAFLFVNKADVPWRQRFTLAHEFGHARLRHGSILDSNDAIYGGATTPTERIANDFAAELLMPKPALRSWLDTHAEGKADLEVLVHLAVAFGVSAQAMRFRLENTGILGGARGDGARIAALDDAIDRKQHTEVRHRLAIEQKHDSISAIEESGKVRVPAAMKRAGLKGYERGTLTIERLAAGLRRSTPELEAELAKKGIRPFRPAEEVDPEDASELDAELDSLLSDDPESQHP